VRRTGIDLSSTRCNVVDAEASGGREGEPATFHVHRFSSVTHLDNTEALTSNLKALVHRDSYPRRAWVNLWDVRSSHQYVLMPLGADPELETRARHLGASLLGMDDLDVTVATSIGGTRGEPGHPPKREVSFFAAGSDDIRARLRPILDAGFLVDGVTTPCGALWSQARLRRASLPDQVHAHVVLGVSQSAIGIFGDGSLLYAKDFDWGYADVSGGVPVEQDREVLANRLSVELRRSFLYLKQYWEQDVSQVVLCGDMPDIRSLTAPLIERVNIEVETLDTLEGIDSAALPEGFADRAATLRLALSIAVDPPPVNLLPVEVRATRATRRARRLVVLGTAAAVAFGAFLYGHARVTRLDAERQLELVRREISSLPAPPAAANATRAGSEAGRIQRAALQALDGQGPAMARVLETVARAAPRGVTLQSLRVLPDGSQWNVSLTALAAGGDQAASRAASERFLSALAESPMFGEVLGPPTRRLAPGGVEVAAAYRVRR
jgi:Tfp pilus assembly protein PilN